MTTSSTHQKTCAVCPNCGAKTDACVDDIRWDRVGPWFCRDCDGSFMGHRVDGAWVFTPWKERREQTLDLLVLNPQTSPVYLALRSHRIEGGFTPTVGPIDGPDAQDTAKFSYEEHSCPTNWLRNIVMVAFKGNTDPHGLIEFVRRVPCPPAIDGADCQAEDAAILEAFPEMGQR